MDKDFGDFQTPPALVEEVLTFLNTQNKQWTRAIEPTCGQGNFIAGVLKQAQYIQEVQGIEIQDTYVEQAKLLEKYTSTAHVRITRTNIFDTQLQNLGWHKKGPLLVLGNPPWVTNSALGTINSSNLPIKENIKGLSGMDARTGGANFDIAEYICIKLLKEFVSEDATIALLCKTSVARNVLVYAYEVGLPFSNAAIRYIDAKKWFKAAVDACLLYIDLGKVERQNKVTVFQDLQSTLPISIMTIMDGQLIKDAYVYQQLKAEEKARSVIWRQGIKHDTASIMELTYQENGALKNKLGEEVLVEPEYVYPLLKSSDLFHYEKKRAHKAVIVTQQLLGQDTRKLEQIAPKLWEYLSIHVRYFEQRKSSIYEGQPPFAIFGIGDYSFAPYKVAISGLHKVPIFRAVGPIGEKPVMLDDTCYFLPCYQPIQAALFVNLLNDPLCLEYIRSIIFLEAKRPITKKLLQRINLAALLELIDGPALWKSIHQALRQLGIAECEMVHDNLLKEIFNNYTSDHVSTKQKNKQIALWSLA